MKVCMSHHATSLTTFLMLQSRTLTHTLSLCLPHSPLLFMPVSLSLLLITIKKEKPKKCPQAGVSLRYIICNSKVEPGLQCQFSVPNFFFLFLFSHFCCEKNQQNAQMDRKLDHLTQMSRCARRPGLIIKTPLFMIFCYRCGLFVEKDTGYRLCCKKKRRFLSSAPR